MDACDALHGCPLALKQSRDERLADCDILVFEEERNELVEVGSGVLFEVVKERVLRL